MAVFYVGFNYVMQPTQQVVSSTGDLVLTRARDGHFYADGTLNGSNVRFLVDTGASLVVVSAPFAKSIGLTAGEPTTFHTANGSLSGYIAPKAAISVGPLSISDIRVGVGLRGLADGTALLGQNFLSKFDVTIGKDQMVIKKR